MKIRANFKESTQTFRTRAEDLGIILTDPRIFYPVLSEDGVLSWIKTSDPTIPAPVNIKGPPGVDGVSPTIDVTSIVNGHRITITDKYGDKIFDILNGIADTDAVANIILSKVYDKQEIDAKLNDKANAKTVSNLISYIGIIPDSYGEKTLVDYLNARIDEFKESQGSTGNVATGDELGGVKSATDEIITTESGIITRSKANAVYVDDEGEMSIKKITTDILANGENELIIKGGDSKPSFT